MTEIGVTAKPRKKLGPIAWLGIGIGALILVPVVQGAVAMGNDPAKKPLALSTEDAAGKCIGELQLQQSKLHVVGRPSDFSAVTTTDTRLDLTGWVTVVDLASGGNIKNVTCVVARGHDGSIQTSVDMS